MSPDPAPILPCQPATKREAGRKQSSRRGILGGRTGLLAGAVLWGGLMGTAAVPDEWELVWSDEFEEAGAPDPAKWTYELGGGGWGNGERQVYTDSLENSRVEDGRLIIEAHQVLGSRTPGYTSARLITREKGQWKYGRMEIRAKMPRTTGTWSAIWMLAADTLHSVNLWPDNGEIDIMEHVGYEEDPLFKEIAGDPELPNVHGTVHTEMRNGRDNQGIGGKTYLPTVTTDFHTYAVNWLEDRIEWEIDGEVYFTFLRSTVVSTRNPPDDPSPFWPFSQRFFLILNIAIGGDWGGHFNSGYYAQSPYGPDGIDHDGVWPQRMEVEYVRVYSLPPQEEPSAVPGTVLPTEMDRDSGVLIETSSNSDSVHNLSRIDEGDWAEFVLEAPAAGTYTVRTSVATPLAGKSLAAGIEQTGASLSPVAVPVTGGWQTWESLVLGPLTLQAGLNTLRLSSPTGGVNVGALQLEAEETGTWKGLPVDAFGNVNTQSWLKWINVAEDPWIFSYSLDNWIFPETIQEPVFNTGSQWIYVLRP